MKMVNIKHTYLIYVITHCSKFYCLIADGTYNTYLKHILSLH